MVLAEVAGGSGGTPSGNLSCIKKHRHHCVTVNFLVRARIPCCMARYTNRGFGGTERYPPMTHASAVSVSDSSVRISPCFKLLAQMTARSGRMKSHQSVVRGSRDHVTVFCKVFSALGACVPPERECRCMGPYTRAGSLLFNYCFTCM